MTKKTFETEESGKASGTVQDEVVPLGRYLDGLTLSVYGRMYEQTLYDLDTCQKSQWDSTRSSESYPVGISIDDLPAVGAMRMQDYGRDGYQFHLDNEYLNLRLSGRGPLPSLRMRFKASLLYHLRGSLHDLGDIASEVCAHFLEEIRSIRVSECAVAVDFQNGAAQIPQIEDAVGRCKKWSADGEGSTVPTGLTLGKHSKRIEFQIYNKTTEIGKSRKQWMRDFWAQHEGYDPSSTVYRAEFRFRRELLNLFRKPHDGYPEGINTLDDLEDGLGDLLRYAVGGEERQSKAWLRFCTPESRETRTGKRSRSSYRPDATWWKAVASEFITGTTPSGRVRMNPGSSYSPEHTRKALYAYTVKRAAELCIEKPGWFPSFDDLVPEAVKDDFCSILAFKGITWEEAVMEKVNELHRRGCAPVQPEEEVA